MYVRNLFRNWITRRHRMVICPMCMGKGETIAVYRWDREDLKGTYTHWTTCPTCRGKGKVRHDHSTGGEK